MKPGNSDNRAGTGSLLRAWRNTSWLNTAFSVNATSNKFSGIGLAKENDGIVRLVGCEQIRALVAQRPKIFLEHAHEVLSGDRADLAIAANVAVGPIAKP